MNNVIGEVDDKVCWKVEQKRYLRERRMNISNHILKHYFKILLRQCYLFNRCDRTLIEYINELEYRNLKYSLKLRN